LLEQTQTRRQKLHRSWPDFTVIEFDAVNTGWILLCAILVCMMQAGFTAVESGMVRSKNSINVAFKNLSDFYISCTLFALLGFGLMFGRSAWGLVGTEPTLAFGSHSSSVLTFFFFQMVFCGTATTIVSGAVAERMRFSAYCVTAVIISGLIYPVTGHWAWGSALGAESAGWLGKLGFIDFAGSSVVHAVGGWVSLAAVLLIGPRVGRFGEFGRPVDGHDLTIATLGVFLLWFGWFGFNGGSSLGITDKTPTIIINTALGGAAGGLSAMALTWWLFGVPQVDRSMNGVLAGLVAITAGCHLLTIPMAIVVGAVGGVVCVYGSLWLERLEIDDAVGAVPVHLFAGIWGTLAVVLAPDGSWGEGVSRGQQFMTQLIGSVSIAFYAFCVSYALLWLVNLILPLRVTANDERLGLNFAEHAAGSSLLDLIVQMDRQARKGDFRDRVDVEPETEAARIAVFYNAVLDKFNIDNDRLQMAMKKLGQLAHYDTLTGLGNRRLFFEALGLALARMERFGRPVAVLYIDLDRFKIINDRYGHEAGDQFLKEAARRMIAAVRERDNVCRLGGDEFAIVAEGIADADEAMALANRIHGNFAQPFDLNGQPFQIQGSVGVHLAVPGGDESVVSAVKKADEAMYTAKVAGPSRTRVYQSAT